MGKKRKYCRKCPICGERVEQSNMVRCTDVSSGWMCDTCFSIEHPEYAIDEW